MQRKLSLIPVTVLTAVSLAACGGSSSDYCELYKTTKQEFSNLNLGKIRNFDKLMGSVEQLRDAAPNDSLTQAWTTLDDLYTALQDGLKNIGLTFEDYQKLQSSGKPSDLPENFDPKKVRQLGKHLNKLAKEKNIQQAENTIQSYAKNTCKIDV